MLTNNKVDVECTERQQAELEFLSSAYTPDEAWWENKCNESTKTIMYTSRIHRRLCLPISDNNYDSSTLTISLLLQMPKNYPVKEPLHVVDIKLDQNQGRQVDNNNSNNNLPLQKAALNALPSLLTMCRKVADENQGEESLFLVFTTAEEWIHVEWPKVVAEIMTNTSMTGRRLRDGHDGSILPHDTSSESIVVLGRRLIYSHHIISKKKRADMKALAAEYSLTGFMKIGWPGLLILEGNEDDCHCFYDAIRPWSWQYLVVRGEQQEVVPKGKTIDSLRRFDPFVEVEDMSVVAEHCRNVGLEALFRTSMKQYEGFNQKSSIDRQSNSWYGSLVLVDHMNDGKGYRKWLRKCSRDCGCFLFLKQYYPGEDYTHRPKIFVGLIGDKQDVSTFLKRWRTSRVDVDSKGQACLERQMAVLSEGELDIDDDPRDTLDWETAASEEEFTTTQDKLGDLVNIMFGTRFAV